MIITCFKGSALAVCTAVCRAGIRWRNSFWTFTRPYPSSAWLVVLSITRVSGVLKLGREWRLLHVVSWTCWKGWSLGRSSLWRSRRSCGTLRRCGVDGSRGRWNCSGLGIVGWSWLGLECSSTSRRGLIKCKGRRIRRRIFWPQECRFRCISKPRTATKSPEVGSWSWWSSCAKIPKCNRWFEYWYAPSPGLLWTSPPPAKSISPKSFSSPMSLQYCPNSLCTALSSRSHWTRHLTAECVPIFPSGMAGSRTTLMLFLLVRVSGPQESSSKKPAIFVDL